jgi:hypothetical protein
MICEFQLLWLMHMRITVSGEVSFCRVEGFKTEQRAAIKFCVKLKKTATEISEMLKSAYGEERLSRASLVEWHKNIQKLVKCECKNRG